MKTRHQQQGAASLLTAVMLIIATTLVVITSGKTVLQETKITANSYRTAQANTAANAAMDYAVAYFQVGGLDQLDADGNAGTDSIVDYRATSDGSVDSNFGRFTNIPTANSCAMPETNYAFPITLDSGDGQTTLARFYFVNRLYDADNDVATADTNPCNGDDKLNSAGTNMNAGMIVAQGWSDDCSAVRTITQCITVSNGSILKGTGPKQPFVSRGPIGVGGSATIINRYTNTTMWAGDAAGITGAALDTYTRTDNTTLSDFTKTDGTGDLDTTRLHNVDPSIDTQAMTNKKNGIGIDVITGDPSLNNQTADEFFELFFRNQDDTDGTTKQEIKDLAGGQLYPGGTTIPDGVSSLVWVEGDAKISNGTIGTEASPVILIIEGDLQLAGNTAINGVVYVMGELKMAGTADIIGAIVCENLAESTGTGSLTIVFRPFGDGSDSEGTGGEASMIPGSYTIVNGSWRDW